MSINDKTISKFLSLVLRHKPETIGLSLDEAGWADVSQLLQQAAAHAVPISLDKLKEIVSANDKHRFVFSEDQQRIRAAQGHSLAVDLQLKEMVPPERLYHGTALQNIASIKAQGLQKRERQHVHLSTDRGTAKSVGARYGKPYIFTVASARMHRDGFHFFLSDNGVWLTDRVPPEYLSADDQGHAEHAIG
jgi:putative RNA 2'-phosphotransferase